MNNKNLLMVFIVLASFGLSNSIAQNVREVNKTFQMEKNGRVSVDTYKGSVIVETWDKAEVSVYAKIEPDRGFGNTSSKEQLKRVGIVFHSSSNYVSVKSDYDDKHSWFGSNTRAFVNYRIKMPRTAKLEIEDYKSETEIKDIQSSIGLNTYKGTVNVHNLNGAINLETYKGDVEIMFAKLSGDSEFETYKGTIKIYLPKNTGFTLDADFGHSTDFYTDFKIKDDSNRRRHKDYEFRCDVNGGGPDIKITSDKGRIELLEK